jgi:hypothetical protein
MDKLMALLLLTRTDATRLSSRMCFIDDYEVGAIRKEGSTAGIALHKVDAHDQVFVVSVHAQVAARKVTFQSCKRTCTDNFSVNVELGFQFLLPLVTQMRWANDTQSLGIAPIKQLAGNHRSFNGLPNTYVIGDEHSHEIELERHDERHKLVRAWPDRESSKAAKRSCAVAQA